MAQTLQKLPFLVENLNGPPDKKKKKIQESTFWSLSAMIKKHIFATSGALDMERPCFHVWLCFLPQGVTRHLQMVPQQRPLSHLMPP